MKIKNSYKGLSKFFVLWVGQTVSTLGSGVTNYALILWIYSRQGTATSIALLSSLYFLPSVFFAFIAGTIADKWDKKKIMLLCDTAAAVGTVAIAVLYYSGALQVWHLYLVNFLISFMNAFQSPASNVAVSLLVPKEQYVKVGGFYALSGSLKTVFTPAIATALVAFGGLHAVFILDLSTFLFAFLSLLLFIRVPKIDSVQEKEEPFQKKMLGGVRFLREHRPILKVILFFAFINFISYLTGFGILPALILSRTGGNETILGMVSTTIGIGTLIGSVLVTVLPAQKNKTRVAFLSCGISFLICNILWAVSTNTWVWLFAALVGNLPLPFLNANLSTIMRLNVPTQMQGRVFAARDTLQFFTIPIGTLLGGVLADHVFEPFMAGGSTFASGLSTFVGSGAGSGIALMFLITGILGSVGSFLCLRDSTYSELNQ